MVRGLRQVRTMRDVWDERRKGSPSRPDRPNIVRRFGATVHAPRHRPPDGAKSVRAWVFSKRPAGPLPQKQLLVKRTKEPEVDLFDEQVELIVLADLPGVSEQDTRVSVERDLLIIEGVSTGPRGEVHYYKEVILPYDVRKDYERSSKGGILEIRLRPKRRTGRGPRAKKGKRGSSLKAGRRGKKEKRRRRKDESSENKKKRRGQSGAKKTRQRKSQGAGGGR